MKCLETGHVYQPQNRTPNGKKLSINKDSQTVTFVNRQPGQEHEGTTTQELLRILIDRTRHCANCMPHPNNERAIYHLRMALILHEARALERKTEKGVLAPEYLFTGGDGHLQLENTQPGENETTHLIPYRHDWDRQCNHPAAPAEKKAK